ncbi:hypothetical protein EJ06DRAFT_551553, partial [Trichodelitschia bisporula]
VVYPNDLQRRRAHPPLDVDTEAQNPHRTSQLLHPGAFTEYSSARLPALSSRRASAREPLRLSLFDKAGLHQGPCCAPLSRCGREAAEDGPCRDAAGAACVYATWQRSAPGRDDSGGAEAPDDACAGHTRQHPSDGSEAGPACHPSPATCSGSANRSVQPAQVRPAVTVQQPVVQPTVQIGPAVQ